MAIAPTGAIYKSLVFDGEDSRNYGVYITGEAVYNAPGRDVEMVEIPGRNGSFALDKGRFQNIEVSYPAGIFADNEADFAEAISDFRNFLCSRRGYVRLTDEYNPSEYRMAIYKSGLEVSPAQLKAGEFDIVFDCKPQRWLTSGETAVTVSSGGTINNPTLFEASPLLDVYGYGSISFNDYTIEITPQFYGDVDILGSKSGFTYSLRTDLYNSGDTIYLTAKKRLEIEITDPSKIFDDWDEWTMTDSGSGTTVWTARTPSYIEMETNFVDVAIDSSQSSQTITNTFSGTVSINSVEYSLSAVFSATYSKENGTITLSAGSTTGSGFPSHKTRNTMGWASIIANSTKSMLGDPTYIDCDIGEAYLLSDGMPVSLNKYIDLGSDLPKLASGSNTVTFDNTITELKVVPRWWKV